MIRLNKIENESKFTIIPYLDNTSSEKMYRISFDELPNTIKVQDMNVYIDNFNKAHDKISFNYTTSGLVPETNRVFMMLCNERGEPFYPNINYVDYDTGIGYAEFSNGNGNNVYDIQETSEIAIPHKEYILLEKYKFEVEIGKE